MRRAFSFCRCTRTASVLMPRKSSHAAWGSITPPKVLRVSWTLSMSWRGPAITPHSKSAWPPKYLGGHADLLCGVIAGPRQLIDKVHETRNTLGGVMDPHAAWLLLRGIKTLAVRVQRQNENALRIAQFLAQHPKVRRVHYPFVEGHPDRTLAMEQMHGGGGVVSFEVEGTGDDARRFSEALNLFTLAVSLGGVESLICIP